MKSETGGRPLSIIFYMHVRKLCQGGWLENAKLNRVNEMLEAASADGKVKQLEMVRSTFFGWKNPTLECSKSYLLVIFLIAAKVKYLMANSSVFYLYS